MISMVRGRNGELDMPPVNTDSLAFATEPIIGHTCTNQTTFKVTSFVIYDAPDSMKLPD